MRRTEADRQQPKIGHCAACAGHLPVNDQGDEIQTLRCECGRLLARILKEAVELKCTRCKRVVIVVDGRRFEEAGAATCNCLEDFCRTPGGS